MYIDFDVKKNIVYTHREWRWSAQTANMTIIPFKKQTQNNDNGDEDDEDDAAATNTVREWHSNERLQDQSVIDQSGEGVEKKPSRQVTMWPMMYHTQKQHLNAHIEDNDSVKHTA